jgi:hypothetical protein
LNKQPFKVLSPLTNKSNVFKSLFFGQVLVAHAYNPNNSGGRDQEHLCSKPVRASSSQDPISKTPITKKGLLEWLRV